MKSGSRGPSGRAEFEAEVGPRAGEGGGRLSIKKKSDQFRWVSSEDERGNDLVRTEYSERSRHPKWLAAEYTEDEDVTIPLFYINIFTGFHLILPLQ